MFNIYGDYFFGNKISEYGLNHNRVDYATLAKSFDAVLNNNIISSDIDAWEQVSGFIDNTEEIDELRERIEEMQNSYTADVNEIAQLEEEIDDLEMEQEEFPEVYQWYIVSNGGADILQEINEIVYYNYDLDMYLWGVTHFGTSWDYVLTDIPCNTGKF